MAGDTQSSLPVRAAGGRPSSGKCSPFGLLPLYQPPSCSATLMLLVVFRSLAQLIRSHASAHELQAALYSVQVGDSYRLDADPGLLMQIGHIPQLQHRQNHDEAKSMLSESLYPHMLQAVMAGTPFDHAQACGLY